MVQGLDSQGLNPFSYVLNRPTSGTDPTGNFGDGGGGFSGGFGGGFGGAGGFGSLAGGGAVAATGGGAASGWGGGFNHLAGGSDDPHIFAFDFDFGLDHFSNFQPLLAFTAGAGPTPEDMERAHQANIDALKDFWDWLIHCSCPREPRPSEPSKPAPKINSVKQGKHIVGHPNYIPGRSILRADPAKLAKRAGTGKPMNNVPRGQAGFKERVEFDEVIGDFVKDGVATPTKNGMIAYAKDGSIHIIPVAP